MGDAAGRGTPVSASAAVRSLVGKSGQPKAPTTRLLGKKRAAAAAATPSSASKPRVTRRELKKLTEMDLEEKDEIPGSNTNKTKTAAATASEPVKAFGEDATSSFITPSSLHDDFVNLMKAQGLEKMATEAGIMKSGALVNPSTPQKSTSTAAAAAGDETPVPSSAKKALPASATKSEPGSPSFASPSPGKKRKYIKLNKGLRHFSMKVCQKVEEKHVTSYNEVADELVREFVTMRPNDSAYDEKNIRRRVYDALNVLMAMDIISKERKEIRWKGLPSSLQHDTEMLLTERSERLKSVEQKKQHLQDLLVQQVAMKNLLKRNAARRHGSDKSSLDASSRDEGRIFLPFIAVNTNKDTVIQCEMSEDRQDIFFNFSAPFEINDDTEILRRLGLHQAPYNELKQMVPEKLLSYLPAECETKSEDN